MRVSHGVHRPRGSVSDLPAWQLVLPPDARFTGLTAAGLNKWWVPPLPPGLPVFAASTAASPRPRRPGLQVSRHPDLPAALDLNGLRVDPPAYTLLSCARDLGLLDVIVLVDSALHREDCTAREIATVAAHRRRGAPRLRTALALADSRSESAWETLLRVLHVTCEIDVVPQYVLQDQQGAFLGRADLWIWGTNALHEYDGEHHLSRHQQRRDLRRARRLTNDEWVRRGYTSADLLQQAVTVLRDADLALGREHRPSRIRRWHELLRDSLFTSSGQQRLRRRLGVDGPPDVAPSARAG